MSPTFRATIALLVVSAIVGGCATRPATLAEGPNYAPIPGRSATAHAALYAECVGQSVAAKRYDIVTESSSGLIRFLCTGDPARALYGEFALAARKHGSQWSTDGRQFQSPQKIKHDLFGVDFCSTGAANDFQCEIVLNVGEFLIK